MIPQQPPAAVAAWGEFSVALTFSFEKPRTAAQVSASRLVMHNAIVQGANEKNIRAPHMLVMSVSDLVRNGIEHSDANDPIELQFAFGVGGLVVAYRDGGSYFSRQEIKRLYELKQPNHLVTQPKFGIVAGGRVGTGMIYDIFEKIHIDTTERVFYGLQSVLP
jgi:hypothetical protein